MAFGYVYYRFRCGVCTREYTNRLSPILLGTGRRRCKGCGSVFPDGCKEWPELTRGERFRYFLPPTVLGFVLGAVIVALASILISPDDVGMALGGILFLIFVLPWLPYFLLQWRYIPKSRDRYARRLVMGNGDEFILSA